MNEEELRARFEKLHVWSADGQRAPNKPLLALWAIGRCLGGEERLAPYVHVEHELVPLLVRFGPWRERVHPEFAFGRLRNDLVWEIDSTGKITEGPGGDVRVVDLRRHNARGGFPEEVFDALRNNEKLAVDVASSLVDAHFPDVQHDAVLDAMGITPEFRYYRRRYRNPKFAREVLGAYGHRCAVCAFALRLDESLVALEGAHIRWHCANGPDKVKNGLALCALHHELFDVGAFTVSLDRKVVVAKSVSGEGVDDTLKRFHRQAIARPASDGDLPDPVFLRWHKKQVFASDVDIEGRAV